MNGVKYFPFGVKLLIFKSNHFERHKKILRIINVKQQLIKIIVTSFGKHLTSSNVQKNSKKKRKKESKNPQTKDINKKHIFSITSSNDSKKRKRETGFRSRKNCGSYTTARVSARDMGKRKKERKKKEKKRGTRGEI